MRRRGRYYVQGWSGSVRRRGAYGSCMGELMRQFTRRVVFWLVMRLLALVILVAGAANQIYHDTRQQAMDRVVQRQELLATQTGRAVADFFDGILDNLDLLRRSEGAESLGARERVGVDVFRHRGPGGGGRGAGPAGVTPGSRPVWLPASRPVMERVGRGVAMRIRVVPRAEVMRGLSPAPAAPGAPGAPGAESGRGAMGPGLSLPRSNNLSTALLLWRQLENRCSHLLAYDPDTGVAMELGHREDAIPTAELVEAIKGDLEGVSRPGISNGVEVNGAEYIMVYAPVVTPEGQRRVLAATVPMEAVRQRFLRELSVATTGASESGRNGGGMREEGARLGYVLFDATGRTLEGSSAAMEKLTPRTLTTQPVLQGYVMVSEETKKVGEVATSAKSYMFRPKLAAPADGLGELEQALVSVCQVDVEGPDWTLVLASPVSEVDDVLSGLFRKTLFWSCVMVLATTTMLMTTSLRLIRDRMKLEREQQAALRRELEQARRVQLEWLPGEGEFECGPGLRGCAVNVPASHVSGDFYNWFRLPDGRWAFVVGDVTGHGMSAAMQMSSVQLLTQSALLRTMDAGKAMEYVNNTLCLHDFNGQFVTLQIAVVDTEKGVAEVATAGHPPPLLRRGGGSFEWVDLEPGLMAGVSHGEAYATQRVELEGGSVLVMYTDGLPEAMDGEGKMYGMEKVRRDANRFNGAKATELAGWLVGEAEAFMGERTLGDDLTLLVVEVRGGGGVSGGPTP